jgi:hypothetical protein
MTSITATRCPTSQQRRGHNNARQNSFRAACQRRTLPTRAPLQLPFPGNANLPIGVFAFAVEFVAAASKGLS